MADNLRFEIGDPEQSFTPVSFLNAFGDESRLYTHEIEYKNGTIVPAGTMVRLCYLGANNVTRTHTGQYPRVGELGRKTRLELPGYGMLLIDIVHIDHTSICWISRNFVLDTMNAEHEVAYNSNGFLID